MTRSPRSWWYAWMPGRTSLACAKCGTHSRRKAATRPRSATVRSGSSTCGAPTARCRRSAPTKSTSSPSGESRSASASRPPNREMPAPRRRELALPQGTRRDDFRDEDPGRILHEMRYGEMTAFEERPHSPYFGNADATPLFVVLLDEYERWTGDTKLVRELEYEARAALNWIDEYADLMGNGYISYRRRNT